MLSGEKTFQRNGFGVFPASPHKIISVEMFQLDELYHHFEENLKSFPLPFRFG